MHRSRPIDRSASRLEADRQSDPETSYDADRAAPQSEFWDGPFCVPADVRIAVVPCDAEPHRLSTFHPQHDSVAIHAR